MSAEVDINMRIVEEVQCDWRAAPPGMCEWLKEATREYVRFMGEVVEMIAGRYSCSPGEVRFLENTRRLGGRFCLTNGVYVGEVVWRIDKTDNITIVWTFTPYGEATSTSPGNADSIRDR